MKMIKRNEATNYSGRGRAYALRGDLDRAIADTEKPGRLYNVNYHPNHL